MQKISMYTKNSPLIFQHIRANMPVLNIAFLNI
jgi:hypothetical protein